MLLAQRAFNKKQHPGKWAASVAGTVEGETYDSNIYKEAKEELGINGISFTKGPKVQVSDDYNFFCQWYLVTIDHPVAWFKYQVSEVAQTKWVKISDLLAQVKTHPQEFTPSMSQYVSMLEPFII